jgi:hypothetical protein
MEELRHRGYIAMEWNPVTSLEGCCTGLPVTLCVSHLHKNIGRNVKIGREHGGGMVV